jgi:D-3-phosphoglycerate dehydrogenase
MSPFPSKEPVKIAVSSASFCKNSALREELEKAVPHADIKYSSLKKDVLDEDELADLASDSEVLIVGRELINTSSLSRLSNLKVISKYGVGLDNIDFDAAKKADVEVYFESGVNSWEVTELAICLMINCLRKVVISDRHIHSGSWKKDGGTNLSGKTVGIIGCGHIGTKVAGVLKALNCKILINDILDKTDFANSIGAKFVSKEEIYKKCDVITLHTPLTTDTRHLICEESLSITRDGVCIINTARGALVEENSLISALKSGKILAAGMDVFENEPHLPKELYTLENFVGTAHIGGSSSEASMKMGQAAIRGLERLILDKIDQE